MLKWKRIFLFSILCCLALASSSFGEDFGYSGLYNTGGYNLYDFGYDLTTITTTTYDDSSDYGGSAGSLSGCGCGGYDNVGLYGYGTTGTVSPMTIDLDTLLLDAYLNNGSLLGNNPSYGNPYSPDTALCSVLGYCGLGSPSSLPMVPGLPTITPVPGTVPTIPGYPGVPVTTLPGYPVVNPILNPPIVYPPILTVTNPPVVVPSNPITPVTTTPLQNPLTSYTPLTTPTYLPYAGCNNVTVMCPSGPITRTIPSTPTTTVPSTTPTVTYVPPSFQGHTAGNPNNPVIYRVPRGSGN